MGSERRLYARRGALLDLMRALLIALLLAAPLYGRDIVVGEEYRGRLWKTSVAALVAANAADVHSSIGEREANPFLRGSDGRFAAKRGVAIKAATVGVLVLIQHRFQRKHKRRRRPFAHVNLITAGAVAGVAATNYGRRH